MNTANRRTLVFGKDISPSPSPLHPPSKTSARILIIGGGVIGLITAWTLLDQGYHVMILSEEWASYGNAQRLTSQIAGALWEYPPAVCGQHTDAISLQHSKRWCMVSYDIWDAIASIPALSKASGVRMKPADFFFPIPLEDDSTQMSKMLEIMASGVRRFQRNAAIVEERHVAKSYGVMDAYEHLAPIIDTDVCMAWLQKLVSAKGAKLVTRTIHGDLFDQEDELRDEFNADVIVNATGLAGTELAGDESCYPIRGAVIRVVNDGRDFPKVKAAMTISADVLESSNEFVFLLPRNDNILLIGGIAEPHTYDLDLTLESPVIKRMRARCEDFLPALKKARLDADYPLAQGLRPFRQGNVRVERELRKRPGDASPSRIVHNYGHGGAGWTISFGCAGDVLKLVEDALLDVLPRPMKVEFKAGGLPVAENVHVRARL